MIERSKVDRLDEVVDTVLTSAGSAAVPADPELASLWRLVVELIELPSEDFRTRLGADLAGRAARSRPASPAVAFVRPGFHSLTPYLLVPGAARLIEFMRQAFGAEEVFRANLPDGSIMHAEVRIADSRVELSDGGGPWQPRPAAIHLYVEDADATYARALGAGATSLVAPTDMPYGDREGDVEDPFGNHWYIGTCKEGGPIRPGLRSVTPALHARGADRLIDFVKQAFGAEELERDHAPDGSIAHAKLKLGDSVVELGEAHDPFPPMPASLHYYVEDTDAVYASALRAGATSLGEPSDRPYGDRAAEVADPFGNHWYIATHVGGPASGREDGGGT
jgi:uncharacterized glyoxalase superfamily protein PhnB